VPGVGKSTFIDQLGTNLTAGGARVAVLAIDPSSARSGGSILGDKTRMARLAVDPNAFVRPSPTAGTLGGVARATRETILVMEAAGYDVVLVETVGVGQSEYMVADMVDTFLLLTLARTGDQLQGMKRGILELADVIAVNKADEAHEHESERAAQELAGALRFLHGEPDGWRAPVVTCSGLHDLKLDHVWRHVLRHRAWLEERGDLEAKRRQQLVEWSRAMVRDRLLARLDGPGVREVVVRAEAAVRAGEITPEQAAERILAVVEPDER
jgi:LAO/AO transport system kinase